MIILKSFVEAQHYYVISKPHKYLNLMRHKRKISRIDGKHTDRKNILCVYAVNGSLENQKQLILYSSRYKFMMDVI